MSKIPHSQHEYIELNDQDITFLILKSLRSSTLDTFERSQSRSMDSDSKTTPPLTHNRDSAPGSFFYDVEDHLRGLKKGG